MTTVNFQCRPASNAERSVTIEHLKSHTESAIGHKVEHIPFGLMGYDGQTLICSVVGKIFFNWLHLDLIWVDEGLRGQGVGKHMMELTAAQARGMNLSGIEIWTQSWQAPDFYRKIGYEQFAVIDDFIPNEKRYAFRLYLQESARP